MTRAHRSSAVSGFTLIEMLIVIVVLGIAAVAITLPFLTSSNGGAKAFVTQDGMTLAQGEADQLLADRAANGFGAIPTGNAGCALPILTGFSCTRSVCYVPAGNLNDTSACTTATDYKLATITVTNPMVGNLTTTVLFANF